MKRTKKQLLNQFEKQYREAYENERDVDDVIDLYMNMETDLFDSDDLNQIIDKIENEK